MTKVKKLKQDCLSLKKFQLFFSGGFHPRRVLPCVLDIGTNNQKLIDDPRYLGSKHARLEGEEYYEFVDEFMVIWNSNLQKIKLK